MLPGICPKPPRLQIPLFTAFVVAGLHYYLAIDLHRRMHDESLCRAQQLRLPKLNSAAFPFFFRKVLNCLLVSLVVWYP